MADAGRGAGVSAPPRVDPKYARDGLLGCCISSAGAAGAVLFTNPMDTAQTRLKMQNELLPPSAPRPYANVISCLADTARREGVGGLQRGLSLAIVREGSKNFFRLGFYDPLLIRMQEARAARSGRARAEQLAQSPPMWMRFAAGATSGAISALVCNPLDLLKSRVQAEGRVVAPAAAGELGSAEGARRSWPTIARDMVRIEGWPSLMRGTGVSVFRSALGTGVTLTVNDGVKGTLTALSLPPGFVTDALSAAASAVALTYTINPPDVVRVRLYNQPVDEAGRGHLYSGVLDCALKMWRTEGLLSFFKGANASMLRVMPHVVLTLTFIGVMRREAVRREQARLEREWAARTDAADDELVPMHSAASSAAAAVASAADAGMQLAARITVRPNTTHDG